MEMTSPLLAPLSMMGSVSRRMLAGSRLNCSGEVLPPDSKAAPMDFTPQPCTRFLMKVCGEGREGGRGSAGMERGQPEQ